MHSATSLIEHLRSHPCQGFTAKPRYNRLGNFVELYWEDADCFADPQEHGFHLMRAMDDRRVVGVKIHGVSTMVEAGLSALAAELAAKSKEITQRFERLRKVDSETMRMIVDI